MTLSWLVPQLELMARIALGTGLGAVIGLERDLHGRPAGLRTHALVALGSATFMVVSTRFVFFQRYAAGDLVEVDGSRIAASVVSGIGFLGAGAILRTGISIRGLTTAAALWLVAAIGLAAGGGMYAIAVFATVIGLFTLTMLRWFEDRGEPVARQRVSVIIDEARTDVPALVATLTRPGVKVLQEEYERDEDETRVTFEVRAAAALDGHELARHLDGLDGIKHLKIERL
ncbi:MAG TPA: MgtC/SapB family protein [Polyangia bacterium]|nr:MgtC/SapB family protein [Polyangia bacterium]